MKKGIILIMFLLILPLCFASWSQTHANVLNSDILSYPINNNNFTSLQSISTSNGKYVPIFVDVDSDSREDMILWDNSLLKLYLYNNSVNQFTLKASYFLENIISQPYYHVTNSRLYLFTNNDLDIFSVTGNGFTLQNTVSLPYFVNQSASSFMYPSINCYLDTCFLKGGSNYSIFNTSTNSFSNFFHSELYYLPVGEVKPMLADFLDDGVRFGVSCKNGTRYGVALFYPNGTFYRSNCTISANEITSVAKFTENFDGLGNTISFSDSNNAVHAINFALREFTGFPVTLPNNINGFGVWDNHMYVCGGTGGNDKYWRVNSTGGVEVTIDSGSGAGAYRTDAVAFGSDWFACDGHVYYTDRNKTALLDSTQSSLPSFPSIINSDGLKLAFSGGTTLKLFKTEDITPYPSPILCFRNSQFNTSVGSPITSFRLYRNGVLSMLRQIENSNGCSNEFSLAISGLYNVSINVSGYSSYYNETNFLNGQHTYYIYLLSNGSQSFNIDLSFKDSTNGFPIPATFSLSYNNGTNDFLIYDAVAVTEAGTTLTNLSAGNYTLFAFSANYMPVQDNFLLANNEQKLYLMNRSSVVNATPPVITSLNYFTFTTIIEQSGVKNSVFNINPPVICANQSVGINVTLRDTDFNSYYLVLMCDKNNTQNLTLFDLGNEPFSQNQFRTTLNFCQVGLNETSRLIAVYPTSSKLGYTPDMIQTLLNQGIAKEINITVNPSCTNELTTDLSNVPTACFWCFSNLRFRILLGTVIWLLGTVLLAVLVARASPTAFGITMVVGGIGWLVIVSNVMKLLPIWIELVYALACLAVLALALKDTFTPYKQ